MLEASVQYLKGVGPRRKTVLKKIGIETLEDLAFYFPRCYEDRSQFKSIQDLHEGDLATISVDVVRTTLRRTRKGTSLLNILVTDHKKLFQISYFRQDYLKDVFQPGLTVIFSGRVERYQTLQMTNPAYEIMEGDKEDLLHTGRVIPVYPLTERINQRQLRQWIYDALEKVGGSIEEILPCDLRIRYDLMERRDAVMDLHFPKNFESIQKARARLVFEEFLLLQLGILSVRRQNRSERHGTEHCRDGKLLSRFTAALPFSLTAAQQRVIKEIQDDMCSLRCMNRLVQGDVGSGKTVVAMAASCLAIQGHYQVAIMVPSEVLSEQHYDQCQSLLTPLGIRVARLVGSMAKSERQSILDDLKEGGIHLLIGTHALIQEDVYFSRLGLVIIDEQHKFGVSQRMALQNKGHLNPDTLVMTATPIPRTLALTVYGDLDISVIDELPPGRKGIKTYWVGEQKRQGMYQFIRKQVRSGRQVYVIYPLVEESEKMDLKAVTQMFEPLAREIWPDLRCGLIHGRLSREVKENIMRAFRAHHYDILVSTTIIEVGLDVPNATVMVIEEAHRFGLAQLHQLRGRVGRGQEQSYCILVSNSFSPDAKERLGAMTQSQDGFRLAEQDLSIRGPGEFFGVRQHGLPELKIGNIIDDSDMMEQARNEAQKILAKDPLFLKKEHRLLKEEMQKKFWDQLAYLRA